MEHLDVLGLQAFVSVAEQGSFRLASARLNLSATAVSRRVQKLEENLGCLLLSRTTRSVTLTPVGAEFLPRAQELLNGMEGAFEELRTKGRFGEGALTIGCLPTIASYYFPAILTKFTEQAPNPVRIFDLSATDILEYVRTGKVDFAISFIGADFHDLTITPLYTEPMVAVTAPGNTLADKTALNWRDLAGQRLISIGSLSGTRRLIDSSLQAHSIELDWSYEVQHLSTAINFAKAGLGIAVLPRIATELVHPHMIALDLLEPTVVRRIGMIRRNDFALPPAAKALHDIIIHHLREATRNVAA